MGEQSAVRLTCGCQVQTSRDFLGRVVGTIVERGERCPRSDHEAGHVVLMPGRENAAPGGPPFGAAPDS